MILHPYMTARRLIICLSMLAAALALRAASADAIEHNKALLVRLDSIISNHNHYIALKENRLEALRGSLRGDSSVADSLTVARRLYDEYLVYDSDSALHYARISRELAGKLEPDNIDLQTEMLCNEAFVYAASGSFEDAEKLLDKVEPDRISQEAKYNYFVTADYLYSIRALYMHSFAEKKSEDLAITNAYRDSLYRLYPDRRATTLRARIAQKIESADLSDLTDEVIQMKTAVDSNDVHSRDNAINSYWLGRYYGATGDDDNMVKYMTTAAILDAEIENRDIAAIQELAAWLFRNGDHSRAYNYLVYCAEQANASKNRSRMVSLSTILPTVRDAYHTDIRAQGTAMKRFIVALAVLLIILIGSALYIFFRNKRLRRTQHELSRVNAQLQCAIADRDKAIEALERANTDLSEANAAKRGMIGLTFRLTADYINALDEFRKKLLRKLKLKQMDDLGSMIANQELVKEQYRDFYAAFDRTILSIFPDFVEEYNAAAPAEAQVAPTTIEKSSTLNTRLRIHALRRLGVDKSADIARMLNVSIRTVYNNRK